MEIEGIESSGVFYDDSNFPRGFGKSGEFTIAEAEVLHKYGKTLRSLEKAEKEPVTEQEKQFVTFCKGGGEQASSFVEKTWQKYHSIIGRQIAVSAFGRAPIADNQSQIEVMDDDLVDDIDEDVDV